MKLFDSYSQATKRLVQNSIVACFCSFFISKDGRPTLCSVPEHLTTQMIYFTQNVTFLANTLPTEANDMSPHNNRNFQYIVSNLGTREY